MVSSPGSDAASSDGFGEWRYLFKADKTGTRQLKKLLRALHRHMSTTVSPYDSSDLLPSQLAAFYRSLAGNFDQLFLSTPPATIAFIYKNLGCLHSLQPLSDRRFSDPVIPALKVEGWIMWETIQLLLAPDEHASFLIMAVKKWDLVDPDTGKPLPKHLPRRCFPAQADAHMTLWYEGMSDRLRREAEDEDRLRITPVEEVGPRRLEHRRHEREHSHDEDEGDSKRHSALDYFKNPLFRKDEGRPGVIRRPSKHPTFMERGKSTATSIGHVVRNIGSPHLWDGGGSQGSAKDREREVHWAHTHRKEGEESDTGRRKSLPHGHAHRGSAYSSRRGSAAPSPTSPRPRDEDSPRERERERSKTVRHSKSHDGGRGYFPPYDGDDEPASPTEDGMQAGFMPTASPLFATQVARGWKGPEAGQRAGPRSWDGMQEPRRSRRD